MLKQKDFIDLEGLTDEEIYGILETASSMKDIFTRSVKKVPYS